MPIGFLTDAERERHEQRRYPIVVAFFHQTLVDLTDEALDRFDHCLADAYHRAHRDLEDFRLSVASATNEKLRLFPEIGRVVLDPSVRDAELRRAIYRRIPPAELGDAVAESDRIIRPPDDHYFDFLASRYTYLRQFTPAFLDALAFRSAADSSELRSHLYASVLAQAYNFGPVRMARIADLMYQKLAWCTNWYVRDEALNAATTRLVNFRYLESQQLRRRINTQLNKETEGGTTGLPSTDKPRA